MAMTRESAAKESAAKKVAASTPAGKPGTARNPQVGKKVVRKTVAKEKVASKVAAKKAEVSAKPTGRPIPHLSPEEAVAHIQALLDARHERVGSGPQRSDAKQEVHTAMAQTTVSRGKPDAVAGSTHLSSAAPKNKGRGRH